MFILTLESTRDCFLLAFDMADICCPKRDGGKMRLVSYLAMSLYQCKAQFIKYQVYKNTDCYGTLHIIFETCSGRKKKKKRIIMNQVGETSGKTSEAKHTKVHFDLLV